jgi:hypothetical protein
VASASPASLQPAERQAVLEELQRILESNEFHSSPRCQEFLRYIVERGLEGAPERLKERNIGIDVFHRSPSYEPNNDAIVRVRATEVRKRLSQYYDHSGAGSRLRIVLASGSYVPEFRWVAEGTGEHGSRAGVRGEEPAQGHRWKRLAWVMAFAAAVVTGLAVYVRLSATATALYEFWQPSLRSANPVVICLGQPVVYHLSRRVHERYRSTLPPDRLPGPYVIPLKPGDVEAADIIPVPDQYVGAGTAQAAARLSAMLAGWKKPSQVRIGNEFSFYDLRNYPAVLEGAFSNDWTMKLHQRMPFVFVQEGGVRGIRERGAAGKAWFLYSLGSDGKTAEDYAIVSRVFDSGTLEPLVIAAGITQYGTQAAGEFITSEQSFAAGMAGAPKDWQKRNLQILLHLSVIGKVPGKPEVVAIRAW